MDNYKGIYYNETKEQQYYEGGAHFPYKVLFNILLNLGGTLSQNEYINNYNNDNIYRDNYIKYSEEKSLIKYKTRNIDNNDKYRNNPNTLIKHSSSKFRNNNNENSKQKYISRNDANLIYNNYSYFSNRNYATSSNINHAKKNIDNHLLQILLSKKEKEKNNEQKNNDENNSDNRYSFLQLFKNLHNRKRTEYYTNIEKINKIKINIEEKKQENSKNDFPSNLRNKINIIKSYNKGKYSLEINGKKQKFNENKEINNKNKDNTSEIKLNPQNNPYLSYFQNITKKSRNLGSNNYIEYKNTFENNKNDLSSNYTKIYSNNYLFKTSDNNDNNQRNENNNFLKVNINNGKKNSYIFREKNLNNKEINVEKNQNNFGIQKYKRKKINQLYCFKQNNSKMKSGNNIFCKKY